MPRPFFTFDTTGGVFRVIELVQTGSPAVNTVTVEDLMSDWIDWLTDDTSRLGRSPLLFTIPDRPDAGLYDGDVDLDGTTRNALYFFLNNAAGWRIRPAEYDHELRIVGNLYRTAPLTDLFVPTLGAFNVGREVTLSSRTHAPDLSLLKKVLLNRYEVDFTSQEAVLYDDDGTTVLQRWDLDTDGGENVTTSTGVQTKRSAPKL